MIKKIKALRKYSDCAMPSSEKERINKAELSAYNQAIEDVLTILNLNYNFYGDELEVKEGDIIEWSFKSDEYPHLGDELRGKTFSAEVAVVFKKQRECGVYASYGQDYIPFDDCKIIKIK